MRILDIVASIHPSEGGPQHSVRAYNRVWRAMGHSVDVLTLDPPDANYLDPDLAVIAVGRPLGNRVTNGNAKPKFSPRDLPAAIKRVSQIIENYDIVIVHGLWNYSTLLSRIVLARHKVPYVVFIHGMLDPWHKEAYPTKDVVKQILWPFNEGALLKHAKAALFTTQMEIRLADQRYWPYQLNTKLVDYGCQGPDNSQMAEQLAAFHDRFPLLRGKKFLLFLSRIHPKKGCDTLLNAFAACQSELPDWHLVFAGPDQLGWRKTLEDMADELGISDKVHWTGSIGGPVKWGAIRSAEAFILPSHGENFGIVVAEAMACATPVLISDKVNLCDRVIEHNAGFVAPHDLNGTIELIRRYTRLGQADQAEMAQNALACYHAHYELNSSAECILGLLESYLPRSAV